MSGVRVASGDEAWVPRHSGPPMGRCLTCHHLLYDPDDSPGGSSGVAMYASDGIDGLYCKKPTEGVNFRTDNGRYMHKPVPVWSAFQLKALYLILHQVSDEITQRTGAHFSTPEEAAAWLDAQTAASVVLQPVNPNDAKAAAAWLEVVHPAVVDMFAESAPGAGSAPKIKAIKEFRRITGWGLAESKRALEAAEVARREKSRVPPHGI